MATLYRRKDRGGKFCIRYRDESGKVAYESCGTRSRVVALARFREIEADEAVWELERRRVEGLDEFGVKGLTVGALMARYEAFAEGYYVSDGAATSEVGIVKAVRRLVDLLCGDVALVDFGPARLRRFRDEVVALGVRAQGALDGDGAPRPVKPFARETVNKYVDRLRRAVRWGVSEELVDAVVYERLRSVPRLARGRSLARESCRIAGVSLEAAEAVAVRLGDPLGAVVRLQVLTGARPGELLCLRACDFDQSGKVWVARPEKFKTRWRGEVRELFFGPMAQGIVRPFLLRSPEAWLFCPREAVVEALRVRAGEGTVVKLGRALDGVGERYSVGSYRQAVERACIALGQGVWTPNRLRHTRGTEIRRLFGLEAAQVILGHARADVTEVYAERDRRRAIEVMGEIG